MPRTLHFLVPCLTLIRGRVDLCLLFNGAMRWERKFLQDRFPEIPSRHLATCPSSSLAHGDVLTLLLRGSTCAFGILDHDAYILNADVFKRLELAPDDCMVAYFKGFSVTARRSYPMTHFLYLNGPVLADIMARHDVDARIYRRVPAHVKAALAHAGLPTDTPLKGYHSFYDTLHLLYALAIAEGKRTRYLEQGDEPEIIHVGGTSLGSDATKDLAQIYITLRFLELPCNRGLQGRYRRKFGNVTTADQARDGLLPTPANRHLIESLGNLMAILETLDAPTASSFPR